MNFAFLLIFDTKGHLISKCLLGLIVWTKISTKNLTNSALEWVGQTLSKWYFGPNDESQRTF